VKLKLIKESEGVKMQTGKVNDFVVIRADGTKEKDKWLCTICKKSW